MDSGTDRSAERRERLKRKDDALELARLLYDMFIAQRNKPESVKIDIGQNYAKQPASD